MRPFRLTALVMGAALSIFLALFAEHPVLADSGESVPVVPGNGDPVCGLDIAVGPTPSAMSEGVCPEHAIETDETARARAYLIETATPGYTMTRQGPERAIGRLHPEFVKRLAAAIKEARGAGLPFAGIFSAYRPPAFGIGGFADKFHSLHTYGLAVDVTGIGAPSTPSALLWHEIAARHGVICPYASRLFGVCPPDEVTLAEKARVAVTYVEARPERMSGDFRVLAVEAMQKAWPCK